MNQLTKTRLKHKEMWPMAMFSTFFHLLVFMILLNFQIPFSVNSEAPVWYVDLPDLPVAQPQAGIGAAAKQASPEPVPTQPREMVLPSKEIRQVPVRPTLEAPRQQADPTPREFEERIARMEHEAEAKHAAAALELLRKKSGSGTAGMPGATGSEAGSDFVAYVQSRLKDAFKATIAFQTKNPEVAIRVTISRTGRFSRIKMEKSTGDKVFEDAVVRAFSIAESSIPAPPRGEEIDTGFVFRPQSIGVR